MKMDKEEKYFKEWVKSQERRFHCGHFGIEEMAFSAFVEGINYNKGRLKEKEMAEESYEEANASLINFTEIVCKLHGQYRGIYLIYYHIFEWVAGKMLYRRR